MTDDSPAFPHEEVTRHVTVPGLTAHEYALIAFVAAQISHAGMGALDPTDTATDAARFADAALAHRT
jgi:hypothetical protein